MYIIININVYTTLIAKSQEQPHRSSLQVDVSITCWLTRMYLRPFRLAEKPNSWGVGMTWALGTACCGISVTEIVPALRGQLLQYADSRVPAGTALIWSEMMGSEVATS